jgi:hypothetical protein
MYVMSYTLIHMTNNRMYFLCSLCTIDLNIISKVNIIVVEKMKYKMGSFSLVAEIFF